MKQNGSPAPDQERIRLHWLISGMVEVAGALARRDFGECVFDGSEQVGMVRAAALRNSALSLAKAISIGLKLVL